MPMMDAGTGLRYPFELLGMIVFHMELAENSILRVPLGLL